MIYLMHLRYKTLKCVSIATNPAAQGKLLPGGRVNNVQRTLLPNQLLCLGTRRALWQFVLRNVSQPLEIVVARVTKMCRAEAEKDRH